MKYVAHLSTGGTVDIEIDGDENLFAHIGEPTNNRNAGWLVGNHGEMVNLDYCAALVPVSDKTNPPHTIIDSDGDKWTRQGDGKYRLFGGSVGHTEDEIREAYGIDHVVD